MFVLSFRFCNIEVMENTISFISPKFVTARFQQCLWYSVVVQTQFDYSCSHHRCLAFKLVIFAHRNLLFYGMAVFYRMDEQWNITDLKIFNTCASLFATIITAIFFKLTSYLYPTNYAHSLQSFTAPFITSSCLFHSTNVVIVVMEWNTAISQFSPQLSDFIFTSQQCSEYKFN